MNYFRKMRGATQSPPRVGWEEVFWSWLGAFLGMGAVSFLNYQVLDGAEALLLIASLGASALLLYGAIKSPFAQPRNLLGGHIISAFIGVAAYRLLPSPLWLSASLAVATSIAAMHLTRTLHPPGSATTLIAVIGDDKIHALGFSFVLMPVALGAVIMLVVALLVNNLPKNRTYPQFWL